MKTRRRLRREDIEGARITSISYDLEDMDACQFVHVLFTVDRGFSFGFPLSPPAPLETSEVPSHYGDAFEEQISPPLGVLGWLLGLKPRTRTIPESRNPLVPLTQSPILGLFCPKAEARESFIEQESLLLAFRSGLQVSYLAAAPGGIAAGLSIENRPDQLTALEDCWNYFDPAFERLRSKPPGGIPG